ncbi:MAG: FG-GAP-like repeat-containing protein [Armatimonadia bacterium]
MRKLYWIVLIGVLAVAVAPAWAASAEELARQQALLRSMEIKPEQLMPLCLETPVVAEGKPVAIICHPEEAAWRAVAVSVQKTIADTTGCSLNLVSDKQLAPEDFLKQPTILIGNLDNNRHVARLYHNFFVCSDAGFTGRTGYELRSVHNPFGTGHNAIMLGSSYPEGAICGAEALAKLVKAQGQQGKLALGRIMDLKSDPKDRLDREIKPCTPAEVKDAVARYRKTMLSPGEGRTGVNGLVRYGILYHRTGDPGYGQIYKGLMAALQEYYTTDKVINQDGMARYDNDFRDAWTFTVAILWDLLEESGLFSDKERVDYTNLVVRLGLECVLYQGYDRPETKAQWLSNTRIVHNHNTFPGLGILFAGQYMKRHYNSPWANDWITTANGIFNGLKHTSKPMEDAAAYQWLPILHCAIYSLSQGDMTFFEEGNLRRSALDAMQVMDNAGYEVAFGDHPDEMSSSLLGEIMQLAAWYYKDPEFAWGVQRTSQGPSHPLDQGYWPVVQPVEPHDQIGIVVSPLPRPNYDDCARNPQYPTPPNVPYEQTFNKLSLRAGWERGDEYLLLDGYGRGTHMHFDANAIERYARGGMPLLVDGEYIKNAPKYHSSMVIIRNGQAELTPAVTRLDRADMLGGAGCSRTTLTKYNGTDWSRTMLWRPNEYLLVADDVTALEPDNYTLRCCWRPWGESRIIDGSLQTMAPPLRLVVLNVTGQPARLETLKQSGSFPISRFSEQVGLRLEAGQSHRFVNIVAAGKNDGWQEIKARQVQPGAVVIDRPTGADLVWLGGNASFKGEAAILSRDTVRAFGATSLGTLFSASAPVSVELAPQQGTGTVVTTVETELTLQGGVRQKLVPGKHALKFAAFAMPEELVKAVAQAAALPAMAPAGAAKAAGAAAAAPAWELSGFEAQPLPLPVTEVKSDPEPVANRGPIMKLFDGEYTSSAGSVMWPAGKTATITVTLTDDTEVSDLVLREWHMNDSWAVKDRKLELSSDGFQKDIRTMPGGFTETGTEAWGGNVNTLLQIPVKQKARQLRLTMTPATPEASVYLAECEIRGVRQGRFPEITALTKGDLNADGKPEAVVASDTGNIRALDASGKVLWEYAARERARMYSLACADVDGDGRDEVMFGQGRETLGLLSGDGKLLWTANPPRFRSINSDVITVFPGDVNGDKRPEIICGCLSWQYFAYDAKGKMIWRNVIYAHSATTGTAADLNGDGKDEVIAGDTYYQLNVIGHDGKRLWNAGSIGPEMTAVAAADITGDGKPEVFAGVDGGTLFAYAADKTPLWEANLGDKVTRLLPLDVNGDGKQELICAAESAHVFAISGEGKILWRTALPDGCANLAIDKSGKEPRIVVSCGAAGVAVLSPAGKVTAQYPLAARAGSLVLLGDEAVVAQETGTLAAIKLQ